MALPRRGRTSHLGPVVASSTTRILSDLHFGDWAGAVHALPQLDPLLAGVSGLVLNGDTIETRPGPCPAATGRLRESLTDWLGQTPALLITGNHDPDISGMHLLEMADGRILLTHGDIVFEDIVPWSQDAPLARQLVARERAAGAALSLEQLLAAHRRAALALPQRHQAAPRAWKYLSGFLTDTVWPPLRLPRVLRAWAEMPSRTAALARTHRPQARFIVVGHTHRPGVWRRPDGRVVINTGSFCRHLGGLLVDVAPDHLVVRKISSRRREFRPGDLVAEFALAAA
jgi:predicted phosphodiesterase